MVSVVILAYNRAPELLITLKRVKAMRSTVSFPVEVIVVDNGSSDHTVDLVRTQFPEVKLIPRQVNNGIAGWNDGFAIANYPYLLVLDDDSHVVEGLNEAITYLEGHPEVGILGFNIVDTELAGDPLLDPEKAWKHLEKIPGFIGCGALIRKAVVDRVGGFAEWLFIYTHEFEFALRALDAGYTTVFFERTTVMHRASKLNRTNKRLRIFATRNELAIVYKYFRQQRGVYLRRVLLNNLKFIRREGWLSGYYILQGAWAFLRFRKKLQHTPVAAEVQDFYSQKFWATQPVFPKSDR